MHDAESMRLTDLEDELRLALGWEAPRSVGARMDRAVARAIADAPMTRTHTTGRWGPSRLVFVLAATLLLLGAASALTLLQQAAELTPGWRVAYERGERLNLTQTVGGYAVTLERGYLDPNQLVLAFLVEGPEGASQAVARADVRDADGRSYLDTAGGDIRAKPENSAATISSYQVPPDTSGEVRLTATIPELMSIGNAPAPVGPWVFHFSLRVQPAAVVEPAATVTAAGVPITLQRVQITQTAARIQLDLDLSTVRDQRWSRWSMEGVLQQEHGPAQELTWSPLPPEWTGQPKDEIAELIGRYESGSVMVRQTFAGSDAPYGRWTLTVTRLSGADGSGGVRFVDGPWVFTFEVP